MFKLYDKDMQQVHVIKTLHNRAHDLQLICVGIWTIVKVNNQYTFL